MGSLLPCLALFAHLVSDTLLQGSATSHVAPMEPADRECCPTAGRGWGRAGASMGRVLEQAGCWGGQDAGAGRMLGWAGAGTGGMLGQAGCRGGQGPAWAGCWGRQDAGVGRMLGRAGAGTGRMLGWAGSSTGGMLGQAGARHLCPRVRAAPSASRAAHAGLLEMCKQCGSEAVSYLSALQDPGTVESADCSPVTACLGRISTIGEVGAPGGLVGWSQAVASTTGGAVSPLGGPFCPIPSLGTAAQRAGRQAGGAG